MWHSLIRKQLPGYVAAIVVIVAATGALRNLGDHVNPPTVALTFVLIILFLATAWGPRPAVLGSILAAACFNFFFLPPVGTFHIAEPEDWIALVAFLITAVTTGQLSARAKLRADEATEARQEIERVYHELQDTFEEASQAKALKQSEQLKAALLDAITHDLRTPLTSIKASASALVNHYESSPAQQTLDRPARREMVEVINEEADRLDRFIEDLMALARIEAGEVELRREWISLEEICRMVLKRANKILRDHHVELDFAHELPPVKVDERAVAEVIYVLIENAAKYSPAQSLIRLTARTDSGMVELAVEDEGEGVPPELRERVFDKFFRATRNGDLRAAKPGTGMGLTIAKGIVEAHGGRIWIDDRPGGNGLRVLIRLPAED